MNKCVVMNRHRIIQILIGYKRDYDCFVNK